MLELKQVPVSEVPIARNDAIESQIAEEARAIYNALTLDKNISVSEGMNSINKLVYDLYSLSVSEIDVIEEFISSKAEIRKSRILDEAVDSEN